MEPEGSLPHSQVLATYTYPEPARSSSHSHFLKIVLIFSSNPCLDLPSGLCPQVSPSKPCMHLSSSPYALHALPISLEEKTINFLIL